jgi:phosphoribosylaminoimidazole carboxylase PurE protein
MANKNGPQVLVLMGSENDFDIMAETTRMLDEFGVRWEMGVVSAHRSPDRCRLSARGASRRGVRVIIAGAGKAAHLAGVVAAHTTLPVIGVPIDAGMFGLDALLATVQMPRGVPVAAMAVGKSGAVNAALHAVAILALGNAALARKLAAFRRKQTQGVAASARRVNAKARRG